MMTRKKRRRRRSESEEEELAVGEDGRTIIGGTVDYSTRCIDGALTQSDAASTSLLSDCQSAFTARSVGTEDNYSTGSTFWVAAGSKPRTVLEKLALQIFEHHTAAAVFDPEKSGAEWWTQCIDSEDDIGLHWDRDYDMEASQGILLHPHLATVTYLSDSGAPTLVAQHVSPISLDQPLTGAVGAAHVCWPRHGKHLAFDGRLLHGSPAELAQLGGKKRDESVARKRVTFLVNVWLNHVPWGSEKLPKSIAKKLARGEAPRLHLAATATKALPVRLGEQCPSVLHRFFFGDSARRLLFRMPFPRELLSSATAKKATPAAVRSSAGGGADDAPVKDSSFVALDFCGVASEAQVVEQVKAAKIKRKR